MEENKVRKYDAFISYRHLKKDMKIAVKLQKLLEKCRIRDPETGKKRNIRIFRDQSELPTSDDLGQDIRNALSNSGFLIVLCSCETKKSKYCMEEIRYFRAMHKDTNFHILPVLLEGEPGEVFPEALLTQTRHIVDESGNEQIITEEVEPLAADVRAASLFGMQKKLCSTEYMRLAAPILGVSYDDLYQRRRRRIIYEGIGIGASALAVSLAFGFYNWHMLNLLTQKQNEILWNESVRLAAYAEEEKGDTKLSVLLAQEAYSILPDHEKEKTDAENMLRSMVLQEEISRKRDYFQLQSSIRFHTESFWICDSYADGRRLAVTDFVNVYLYDTENGNLLYQNKAITENNYFNQDATLSIQTQMTERNTKFLANGYHVAAGDIFFTYEIEVEQEEAGSMNLFPVFDEETGDCYLVLSHYTMETGLLYDYPVCFRSDGERIDNPSVSDEMKEEVDDNYVDYVSAGRSFFTDFSSDRFVQEDREAGLFSDDEEARWEDAEARGYYVRSSKLLENIGFDVLFVSKNAADYKMTSFVYSVENNKFLFASKGSMDYDPDSGLFYDKNKERMDIYAVCAQNLSKEEKPDVAFGGVQISADGTKYISRKEAADLGDDGILYELNIWDTQDMETPVWTGRAWGDPACDRYLYFLTPDMDYIIISDCSTIEVWDVDKNSCIYSQIFTDENGKAVEMFALSLSEDGMTWAVAYREHDEEIRAKVCHTDGGKTVQTIDLHKWFESTWFRYMHMEFCENRLLISGENSSVILSREDGGELYDTEHAKLFPGGNQSYFQPRYMTSDGLLFTTFVLNTPYALEDIYEIDTGEQVFPGNNEARAYSYDPAAGFLVWAEYTANDNANVLRVAEKQSDGTFRILGDIYSQYVDMELSYQGPVQDKEYLLLSGNGVTEIYNLKTLKREFVFGIDNLGIKNGKLYDLEAAGKAQDSAVPFEITMDEVKQRVDQMLRSEDDSIRKLNELEKNNYFIKDL